MISNLVLMMLYIYDEVVITKSFTYLFLCCFFSLLMHMLLINCMQYFISVSY